MESNNICPFVSGLFNVAWRFQGSSCCSVVLESYYFLKVSNTPSYVYTIFCLPTHPLMDIWVVFTFWLLWITPLWTLVCKYLLETLLAILLGVYTWKWDCWIIMVILCLTTEESPNCSPCWLQYFIFPPATYEDSYFSESFTTHVFFFFFFK